MGIASSSSSVQSPLLSPDQLSISSSSSSSSQSLSLLPTSSSSLPVAENQLSSSSSNESISIPRNYNEAINSPHRNQWLAAMNEEIHSFNNFNVMTPVHDNGQSHIDARWIFSLKRDMNGKIEKFKARLVARGFQQKDIDLNATFSPVVDKTTIKSLLVIAHKFKWQAIHFDVKTAFLHGNLDDEIFVSVPEPLNTKGFIFKLNKSIYGLKQSPRVWFDTLSKHLKDFKLNQLDENPCVFIDNDLKFENRLIIACYVDDLLCFGPQEKVTKFETFISKQIKLKNLGPVQKYLGIEINHSKNGFLLSQSQYIESLSAQYQVLDAKNVKCPLLDTLLCDKNDKITDLPVRNLIGSLLYIANWTRPDICTAVNQLSQHIHKPTERLWNHSLNVLKYLYSTKNFSLHLSYRSSGITGYADANFATDSTDRKSISGNAIYLFGSLIEWSSTKQKVVAESTSVSELISLFECTKKIQRIYEFLKSMKLKICLPIIIYDDSQNVIKKVNGCSKNVDVKSKYITDCINNGLIKISFIDTKNQLADPLTKILITNFENIRLKFGLIKQQQ